MSIINKQLIYISFFSILLSQNLDAHKKLFSNYWAISIDGDTIEMKKYNEKKILIVNVASRCGYTPQYKELQKLHEIYGNELSILGFPSNDFLWQEPGSNSKIKNFCQSKYGVTFDMFEKIHVKGKHQHHIYKWLTDSNLNGWNSKSPSWNFFKYLIDEEGKLINYFSSDVSPLDSTIIRYFKAPTKYHLE